MSVLELVGERRASKQVMHIVCGWAKVAASRQATGRAFCSWYLCVSESRSQRSAFRLCSFGLGSRLRFYSPRPFHPFASVVEEWIASEVSLYGVCPTARLGAWLSPLLRDPKISDILINGKDHVFIEKGGLLQRVDTTFRDDRHLMQIIDRIGVR